jgi:hypothetical protein
MNKENWLEEGIFSIHENYVDMIDLAVLSWKIYKQRFFKLIKITLMIAFPIILAQAAITDVQLNLSKIVEIPNYRWIPDIFSFVRYVLGVLSLTVFISIAFYMERIILGEPAEWLPSIRFGFSRIFQYFWTTIVASLLLLGLYALLIIPGIIWSVFWFFSFPASSLRNVKGKRALDYSKMIVKGKWWRILSSCVFLVVFQAVFFVPIFYLIYISFPLPFFYNVALQTFSQIINIYFLVIYTLFFLNIDYQYKKEEKVKIG